MGKTIKITLAFLFFICLFDMPYGYYISVRFLAFLGFIILAYKIKDAKDQTMLIVYIGLALLFQPFFKIALGRMIWNVVDVMVGVGLLISLLPFKINKSNQ